jgi:hypothetical protein
MPDVSPGNVFITRFHEDDKTFKFSCEDVPRAFSGCKELLTNLIWSYWDSKEPENAILDQQYAEGTQEKLNADKQIILGRMYDTDSSRYVSLNANILHFAGPETSERI